MKWRVETGVPQTRQASEPVTATDYAQVTCGSVLTVMIFAANKLCTAAPDRHGNPLPVRRSGGSVSPAAGGGYVETTDTCARTIDRSDANRRPMSVRRGGLLLGLVVLQRLRGTAAALIKRRDEAAAALGLLKLFGLTVMRILTSPVRRHSSRYRPCFPECPRFRVYGPWSE